MRWLSATSVLKRLETLWDKGLPSGCSTGWKELDRHYTIAPGQMTIVTGWPGSGKSEWLDALLVNLSRSGWKFAMFSFENRPIELHAAKLAEKITGKPFGAGPNERIGREALFEVSKSIADSFVLFDTPTEGMTVAELMEATSGWLDAYQPEKAGVVIDPWNELEHWRPHNLSETEYISKTLTTVRNWARETGLHVWLVAHPAKARREDGKLPVPRPDMISGSQHWWNKADCAVTVWRDMENMDKQEIEIHVQKVRFKHIGRPGLVPLRYDRVTGRYHDVEPHWTGLTRRVA